VTDAPPAGPDDDDPDGPSAAGSAPAALPLIGDAVESLDHVLPHPVESLEEAGPHVLEPPHDLSAVDRFDHAVDQAFDRLRGNPVADRLFYGATELGDFGLVWVLLGATHALRSDRDVAVAARLAATLGVESVLVNGVIKSFFKRERPVSQEPRPYKMRMPLTTSFPSGHSSTAVVASILLSEANPSLAPVYWTVAAVVASSRVYVRIHHASDVVGGVATGLVIGLTARTVWRRLTG
jgi:undecaprenyl-diphosphatase